MGSFTAEIYSDSVDIGNYSRNIASYIKGRNF